MATAICSWLFDRFGVSWLIVPEVLPRLLGLPNRPANGRVQASIIRMKKIDVTALETATAGR
jgi:predicted 3-demethylubiquinone-9 3-methyltransferase (glyoxalase superfamily)